MQCSFRWLKNLSIEVDRRMSLSDDTKSNWSAEHHGKTYNLYGPEQYSFEEAYQKISQVLNHKIKYERIPVDAWIDSLKNFLPPRVLQHFRNGPYRDMPSGIFSGPADTLNEFLGRKPTTLAEFRTEINSSTEVRRAGT